MSHPGGLPESVASDVPISHTADSSSRWWGRPAGSRRDTATWRSNSLLCYSTVRTQVGPPDNDERKQMLSWTHKTHFPCPKQAGTAGLLLLSSYPPHPKLKIELVIRLTKHKCTGIAYIYFNLALRYSVYISDEDAQTNVLLMWVVCVLSPV